MKFIGVQPRRIALDPQVASHSWRDIRRRAKRSVPAWFFVPHSRSGEGLALDARCSAVIASVAAPRAALQARGGHRHARAWCVAEVRRRRCENGASIGGGRQPQGLPAPRIFRSSASDSFVLAAAT